MTLNSSTFDLGPMTLFENFLKGLLPEINLLQYQKSGFSNNEMRTQRVKCSISSFITFGGRRASGSSSDTGFPGFYRSSIQKPTIPLVHRLLVLVPKAVAWLRCCHALQERVPKRWALSYHYLTNPFAQVQKPAESAMYFWYLCHETKIYLILDYFAVL